MINWIGLGRAMSRLSASTYVEFHQATNHAFNPYMPIVVMGAVLGGIVLAILSPGIRSLSSELAIAGSVCNAAVIAIALTTDARMNYQIARWSVQSPPTTGRSFAPDGFDFTLSALSFRFQHWPATSLLVLSVDDSLCTPQTRRQQADRASVGWQASALS